MAQVTWTEPALSDLDAIADYIALENPVAARRLVQRVFQHVEQLQSRPHSGSLVPEMTGRAYRQIIEPPCRVFYRVERSTDYVLHVMRSERLLRAERVRRPVSAGRAGRSRARDTTPRPARPRRSPA